MSAKRHLMVRRPEPGTARFLTFSCYRRLRLFENDQIKSAFADALTIAVQRYGADTLAWVVMPEHVHLIVYFAGPDRLSSMLRSLKRPFSSMVLARWRTLEAPILRRLSDSAGDEHFWQPGGGHDRNIIGDELIEKITYIHKNPITRGLSPDSVSWRWSSVAAYREQPDALGPPVAFHLIPPHGQDLT